MRQMQLDEALQASSVRVAQGWLGDGQTVIAVAYGRDDLFIWRLIRNGEPFGQIMHDQPLAAVEPLAPAGWLPFETATGILTPDTTGETR